MITSHLIVFWLSQTSNVTPPIALAAFAGAGVANARPMQSSVEAFKLAAGLFIIPVMMAYTGLVNTSGDALGLFVAALQTTLTILAMAMIVEGYLMSKLTRLQWLMALIGLPLVLFNPVGLGLLGGALVLTVVVMQWRKTARTRS